MRLIHMNCPMAHLHMQILFYQETSVILRLMQLLKIISFDMLCFTMIKLTGKLLLCVYSIWIILFCFLLHLMNVENILL